jgi:hypothetical protein
MADCKKHTNATSPNLNSLESQGNTAVFKPNAKTGSKAMPPCTKRHF